MNRKTEKTSCEVEQFRRTAIRGDACGQYELGICYAIGNGVERNEKKALFLYQKAAEQGHAGSQFEVGSALLEDCKNNRILLAEAIGWLQKSAAQGCLQAEKQLARHYWGLWFAERQNSGYQSNETSDNYCAEWLYWLKRAALHGDAESKHMVGTMYFEGVIVEKDKKKGLELIVESAKQFELELWMIHELKNLSRACGKK